MRSRLFLIPPIWFCLSPVSQAYSVLTHEAAIDSAWRDNLQPLLRKRFPGATEEELRKAHAYAYGGAIVQDIGYYPFGNKFVSDLTVVRRSAEATASRTGWRSPPTRIARPISSSARRGS